MPEAATATPAVDPNPYSGLGVDDSKFKATTDKLADIKRTEMSANEKVYGSIDSLTSKAIPKLEEMSKTAGVEAEKMKPWNEEAEAKKRESDPIQNFASLGSVFGILASAFTHAPMTSALDASAAAINAIKAGNAEDYNRAYKAWEANTKQAMDRHKIEHEAFTDAASLLSTNMEAANTKLRVNAARFGDQKALALLDAGMDKELFEYKAAQQKLHEDMVKNMVPMAEANAEMAILVNNGYKANEPNNPKNIEALKALSAYKQQMAELSKTTSLTEEQGKVVRDYSTTPDSKTGKVPTPEQRAAFIQEHFRMGTGSNAEMESRAHSYEMDPESPTYGNHNASVDRALKEISEAKRKPLSATEQAIDKKKTEMEAELGRKLTSAEFDKIVADAPKAQTVKAFSTPESARLTYTPTLMKSLQTLDAMMDDSTGLFTGAMKQFAGEYIGVNDPVKLWQSAKKEAEAAQTALAAQGSKSAIALKALLDTLPETPRSSAFGHQQVADKIKAVIDESQTALSTMEAGGKRIPDDVREKFEKLGITTKTNADKNPIAKLDKDPTSLTDDELKNLAGFKTGYPQGTQDKINNEIKRRAAEWEKNNPGQ
jgi:hypothetical protein